MHSYLNRSEHFFSDLEISDPGTVQVTNSYHARSHSVADSYQDHQESFQSNDFQELSYADLAHFQRQPSEPCDDEYVEQARIRNTEELKCVMDEVNCMICFHLVQEPVNCALCEALYCRRCIKEWFNKSPFKQVCPCCRTDSEEYLNKNPFCMLSNQMVEFFKNKPSIITSKVPLILKKILSKIQLKCINFDEGCEEVVMYEARHKHETRECGFSRVACPNVGCYEMIRRNELLEHKQWCQFGKVECRFCAKQFTRCTYQTHINICDHRLQQCRWCRDQQYLFEIAKHEEECPLRQVKCEICCETFLLERYRTHTPDICWRQMYLRAKENAYKLQKQVARLEEEQRVTKEENRRLQDENSRLKRIAYPIEEEKKQDDDKAEYQLEFEEYVEDLDIGQREEPKEDESIEEVIVTDDDHSEPKEQLHRLFRQTEIFRRLTDPFLRTCDTLNKQDDTNMEDLTVDDSYQLLNEI